MKKLFFLLLIIPSFIFAQSQYGAKKRPSTDIGFLAGASFYRGDLNIFDNLSNSFRPAVGLLYRYNFDRRISVRANLLYANVAADDAKSNSILQQQRNLSFKSYIIETSGQVEINFVEYKMGSDLYKASSYVFIGLGTFFFQPKADLNGEWVKLQPLKTEGKNYRLAQIAIPMGLGFKWNVAHKTSFAIEGGMRKTFTDYIDDVSTVYPKTLASGTAAALSDRSSYIDSTIKNPGRQRGNSKNKDWYGFVGFSVSFQIYELGDPCNAYDY